MRLKTKCSFCGAKAKDEGTHIIVASEKAAICTECVMGALLSILKQIQWTRK